MRAQQFTDPVCYHAEGPVWWPRWNTLRWVDMLAGDVMTWRPGGIERTPVGSSIAAALRPRAGGGAVVARETDVAVSEHDDLADLRGVTRILTDPTLRLNEAGVDPQGRFYVGSMSYRRERYRGNYYRISRVGGEPRVVIPATSTSNGLAWSPDGARAYFNDTPTGTTRVFDYDPARGLSGGRTFVSFIAEGGRPDGLCVDADGGVWVALNGKGQVRRYDAAGRLSEVVEVDARRVTSCCFGEASYTTLFVTTSRENVPDGEDPLAGSVFRLDGAGLGLPTAAVAF